MKRVSISELQKNISLVGGGEEIEVTSHGFVVARIIPVGTKLPSPISGEVAEVKEKNLGSVVTVKREKPLAVTKPVKRSSLLTPGVQCKHGIGWHKGCHF